MFTASKLIRGWSQDLSVLGALAVIASLALSLLYQSSSRIVAQYALRNPVSPLIPVSTPVLAVELVGAAVTLAVCMFALSKYRSTRNEYQGVSATFLVLAVAAGFGWIYAVRKFHAGILNSLDLVDGVWLLAKSAYVAAPWPQLVIQSYAELVLGLHKRTWLFQSTSVVLLLTAKCASISEYAWYDVPHNFCTWLECLSRVLALIVFSIEMWLYKDTYIPLDAPKSEACKDD